jgi:hypothetical protein
MEEFQHDVKQWMEAKSKGMTDAQSAQLRVSERFG